MSVNEIEEPDEDDEEESEDGAETRSDGETSFDEFLTKTKETDSDEEDENLLNLTREERLESLSIRAAPKQANEFICRSCRLVKHESQLADPGRELCRDCV